jgi:hypothetical protein
MISCESPYAGAEGYAEDSFSCSIDGFCSVIFVEERAQVRFEMMS